MDEVRGGGPFASLVFLPKVVTFRLRRGVLWKVMVMAPGGFSKPENSSFFDQKMALGENRPKNVFFDLKTFFLLNYCVEIKKTSRAIHVAGRELGNRAITPTGSRLPSRVRTIIDWPEHSAPTPHARASAKGVWV